MESKRFHGSIVTSISSPASPASWPRCSTPRVDRNRLQCGTSFVRWQATQRLTILKFGDGSKWFHTWFVYCCFICFALLEKFTCLAQFPWRGWTYVITCFPNTLGGWWATVCSQSRGQCYVMNVLGTLWMGGIFHVCIYLYVWCYILTILT